MAGIGERTIGNIVNEVTTAIVECLWEDTAKKHVPKLEDEFRSKILDMEEAWQFPCCWSAVDGCHIPIKSPPSGLESCKEYHNFKNFFSVVLMGIVDSKYRFVWASCGYPGNSHDSVIFQSTDLWNQIKNQDYLPKIGKKVVSLLVPPLILGDAAFPLQPWLMKPCTNTNPTLQQRYCNYWLSRARMVMEGNLREGDRFCLEDASAARRIRRRQPLLVSFYITFDLKKGYDYKGNGFGNRPQNRK